MITLCNNRNLQQTSEIICWQATEILLTDLHRQLLRTNHMCSLLGLVTA